MARSDTFIKTTDLFENDVKVSLNEKIQRNFNWRESKVVDFFNSTYADAKSGAENRKDKGGLIWYPQTPNSIDNSYDCDNGGHRVTLSLLLIIVLRLIEKKYGEIPDSHLGRFIMMLKKGAFHPREKDSNSYDAILSLDELPKFTNTKKLKGVDMAFKVLAIEAEKLYNENRDGFDILFEYMIHKTGFIVTKYPYTSEADRMAKNNDENCLRQEQDNITRAKNNLRDAAWRVSEKMSGNDDVVRCFDDGWDEAQKIFDTNPKL